MRFPAAYYLLVLYLTVMLRPVMPLLADAWDHTFAETIHIATIHAQYGANHLEKELAAADKADNTSNKGHTPVKTAEVIPFHLHEQPFSYAVCHPVVHTFYPPLYCGIPLPVVISTLSPPPDFGHLQ